MPDYAKSDGITTVEAHVQHLQDEREGMLPFRSFVMRKYLERTGRDLNKMLHRSIVWHDEGKRDPKWQYHCRTNTLRNVHVRHELISLVAMHKQGVEASSPVRAAIAAHHGKLSFRHEKRWQERPEFTKFKQHGLWAEFRQMGDRAEDIEDAIRKRYEFAGPRSLLQLMDHRASASEGGDQLPPFHAFCYTFPYKGNERGVQKKIEDLWDVPFAILRAPTGSGKTEAALLWAQHQIISGRADRLIIAMPTRFTANALAVSDPNAMSTRGLYHSTSRFVNTRSGQNDPDVQRIAVKEQEMARLLETPITVTTIDHLCICLTGTREDHHGIFFNLAHSCVVIDEADFYDAFTQQNIIVLLTVLRLLDVRVLMMSATVPDSAVQLFSASGFDIPAVFEDESDSDRVRCRLTRQGQVSEPEEIASLLQRALAGKPTIIYANTVRRAQEYYRWFQRKDPAFTRENVVLYHSRFTEPDKQRKEQLLYDKLGNEAWKNPEAVHGVAILTQIGELSVNISADLMISDLCPIDRMAQRVGRLARFHSKVGELFLIEPTYTNKSGAKELYPAPYGNWQNGVGWTISDILLHSDKLLVEGDYTPRRFADLVNQLYPDANLLLSQKIRDNTAELEKRIELNWLILPNLKVEEDADQVGNWQSRNIPPQKTLYANYKISGIDLSGNAAPTTWNAFREFELKHGIQCPIYEFNKAADNGLLYKDRDHTVFQIGEDHTEEIWTVPSQYYDFELGLHLTDEESD